MFEDAAGGSHGDYRSHAENPIGGDSGEVWIQVTPTSTPVTLTNGHTTLQPLTQGAAFFNGAYGAVVASSPIFEKWQSLAAEANAQGYCVQDYIGAPVGDVFSITGGEAQYYERGMIVARTRGSAFVVYGVFTCAIAISAM